MEQESLSERPGTGRFRNKEHRWGKTMKKATGKAAEILSVLLAAAAVLCVMVRLPVQAGHNAAVAAAGFILPSGAAGDFFSKEEEEGNENGGSASRPASAAPSGGSSAYPGSSSSEEGAVSAVSSTAAESSSSMLPGKILEMCINSGGSQYGNIWVKNSNQHHSVDIGQELRKQPAVKIMKNAGPQVLIYHTHTTEAFQGVTRSTDKSKSVCAVGDEIAEQLAEAGIGVLHDTTYHDYPAYNGCYDRSMATVENDLKKYPSIQVTLDIHRDAMTRADGTRLKPTAVIDGKKAAQVMIVSGCDDDGSLGFPNWEYNFRLAARIQKSMSDLYPNLARPVDFTPNRYNENLTKGSLLVEFGTDASTLDEAKYSGSMFGKALADVLNGLT